MNQGKLESWRSWKMTIFQSAILVYFFKLFCFVFFQRKQTWLSYEVSFFLAILMISDYPCFQPKTTFIYYFAQNCSFPFFFCLLQYTLNCRCSNGKRASSQFLFHQLRVEQKNIDLLWRQFLFFFFLLQFFKELTLIF